MAYLVLDTETTGKYPDTAECLSVAIINDQGTVLLNTLVRPERAKSWPDAQRIHGITPADVFHEAVPCLGYVTRQVSDLIRGQEVVIYNASYDTTVLREAFALGPPAAVHCCMLVFSEHPEVRVWNEYHGNYRWQSLATATEHVGHVWTGKAHGALADCYAARDVWAWLTDPAERARLEAAKAERWAQRQVDWYLEGVWAREQREVAKAAQARNEAWEARHYPAMGLREDRDLLPDELRAQASANTFCEHLTGYPVTVWNRYGKLLKLRRYGQAEHPPRPKHLVSRENVYLLKPDDQLQPVAMWQKDEDFPRSQYGNYLTPLYSLRKLVLGVDYVPYTHDYVEGYCSKTALVRDHKLKPKEADQVRPAYRKVSKKYDDYLLYPIPTPQPEMPAQVGALTNG